MKKSFLIILIVCFCFIFAGCSDYPAVGLVNNSDGTILEYYYIPFPEEEMKQLLPQLEKYKLIDAKNQIKQKYDKLFENYISSYQGYVASNKNYTLEEKTELIQGVTFESNLTESNEVINLQIEFIRYVLNFKNSQCYKVFKNRNGDINKDKHIVVEKTLFTTTTKVIDTITEEISFFKQELLSVDELMIGTLGVDNWKAIKDNLTGYSECINNFNYIYVVPTARLYSNANEVIQEGNYYYHIWKINIDNIDEEATSNIKIEYWTVTANRTIWYVIALTISIATIIIVYVVGKKKEKTDNEDRK